MKINPEDPLSADFRNFLYYVWSQRGWIPTEQQYQAAYFLQHADSKRILSARRKFGKTEITATYICWLLYNDPNATIAVVSASARHAMKILKIARLLIRTVDILEHLAPKAWQKDGELAFDCGGRDESLASKEPSVAAYGYKGQITGSHIDHIIPDDIETPENSLNAELREKLIEKTKEFEDMLNPGGTLTYLGTPQSEKSIYFYWSDFYEMIRIPAEYTENQENLAPWLIEDLMRGDAQIGDPVDPDRFGLEEIAERRAIIGESRYALQYLLEPGKARADKYPLKLSDFIVYPCMEDMAPEKILWSNRYPLVDIHSVGKGKDQFYSPGYVSAEYKPYQQTIMTVDPSGHGSDEVGYAIGSTLNGYLHVHRVSGLKGGHDETTLRQLAAIAKEFEVQQIFVEKNFGDGMYVSLLRPVMSRIHPGCAVVDHPHWGKGQKETRIIDVLEPAMNQHRIVIDPMVAKDVVTMSQVVDITRDRGCLKHDDRVESLAMLVSLCVDVMQVDVERVLEDSRLREMKAEMAKWDESFHRPWGSSGPDGTFHSGVKITQKKNYLGKMLKGRRR